MPKIECLRPSKVLLTDWEHRGIIAPLSQIKCIDIQALRELGKTQVWKRLLSIPPSEALALPIIVEQTTSEPTPI